LVRCGAEVTVTDLKTPEQLAPSLERLRGLRINYNLGEHVETDFTEADMILRNADVPRSSRYLEIAARHNVPIEMDESLFCKHFSGIVVGITGTRGKTTTATLIYEILRAHHPKTHLAGNILGCATLPLLEAVSADDIVVLELSSWQLQGFDDSKLSPHAAVFTNVYPDHLNRYAGMDEYIRDKKAIFLHQKDADFCVFNSSQAETVALSKEAPAVKIFFKTTDVPENWRIKLPGNHNLENVAAALACVRKLGVPDQVTRSVVANFEGVEHRLQRLGVKNGIEFINDSTSTTPVAGCAALDAINGKRILLIAGGSDKNLDLSPFARKASQKAAKIALLEGTATESLAYKIVGNNGAGKIVGLFKNLRDAVYALLNEAQAGDVILLSPGCASFGMFQNEYHRGQTFIDIVSHL
jgi:UDP-N-acetylmuramoylalanine--D-glutamate ligase